MNCRNAEVSVFPVSPVAEPKRAFIEARLHDDTHHPQFEASIKSIFDRYDIGDKRPVYVVVDPATGNELTRYSGAPTPLQPSTIDNFVRFLESTVIP